VQNDMRERVDVVDRGESSSKTSGQIGGSRDTRKHGQGIEDSTAVGERSWRRQGEGCCESEVLRAVDLENLRRRDSGRRRELALDSDGWQQVSSRPRQDEKDILLTVEENAQKREE